MNLPQPDFQALFSRPDLHRIGLVLVRPDQRGTDTLWCEPDVDPRPLYERAEEAGQTPGALIFVFGAEVVAIVSEEWQGVRWFTDYVDHLARGIQRAGGLEGFLGQEVGGEAAAWTAAEARMN